MRVAVCIILTMLNKTLNVLKNEFYLITPYINFVFIGRTFTDEYLKISISEKFDKILKLTNIFSDTTSKAAPSRDALYSQSE